MVILVSIVSSFFSSVNAASFWYAFWMKYPDDKIVSNTPSDQPNTNYELHRALIDASSSATVYASSINAIGEKGSTWWVKPKLDEALYRTKYKGLDLVSKPENSRCTRIQCADGILRSAPKLSTRSPRMVPAPNCLGHRQQHSRMYLREGSEVFDEVDRLEETVRTGHHSLTPHDNSRSYPRHRRIS